MSVRTNTEFVANLPYWEELSRAGLQVIVKCPRCSNTAELDGKAWRDAGELQTRPCPYCFMTAKIPDNYYPKSRPPQPRAKR